MSESESDQTKKSGTMQIMMLRGFPMPGVSWYNVENMEAAMDYVPLDDDIILCSYPKTGTTWMSYIIYGILHGGQKCPSLKEAILDAIPYIEFENCVELVKKQQKPRFYKHHLPCDLSKWNPKAKYVYVLRRPEDVIASFYPFSKETFGNESDFDTFFEHFLTGNVVYGNYFDHINSFYEHKNDSNLHIVSYEDLKRDARNEILKVAEFLGEEYRQKLETDPSMLDNIHEMSSFDNMKRLAKLNLSTPDGGNKDLNLIREGKVGQGKKLLNQEQRELLKKIGREKLLDKDLIEKWYKD